MLTSLTLHKMLPAVTSFAQGGPKDGRRPRDFPDTQASCPTWSLGCQVQPGRGLGAREHRDKSGCAVT